MKSFVRNKMFRYIFDAIIIINAFFILFDIKEIIRLVLKLFFKGNYPRTRASNSKHLPALIYSIFLVNTLGLCLIFGLSTKSSVLPWFYMKKLWNVNRFFYAISSNALLSSKNKIKWHGRKSSNARYKLQKYFNQTHYGLFKGFSGNLV